MYDLEIYGWDSTLQSSFEKLADPSLRPARVARVDKGRAELLGLGEPTFGTLAGRFRLERDFLALPTTGDWVACRTVSDRVMVDSLLPRRSCFVRKIAGHRNRAQPVAANIDRVLILTAAGGDFSPARVERYLSATFAGGAAAVVVLSKADLSPDPSVERALLMAVAARAPVVSSSALASDGVHELGPYLEPGKTLAVVGSSGVGKSTLANKLLGREHFSTAAVRQSDETGRHKTTQRELVLAPGGFMLIDTPGMREFGLWDASEGLQSAFSDVTSLAAKCRYRDCGHTGESGCAITDAIECGKLPASRYQRFLALSAELAETKLKVGQRRSKPAPSHPRIDAGTRQRRKLHRKFESQDD